MNEIHIAKTFMSVDVGAGNVAMGYRIWVGAPTELVNEWNPGLLPPNHPFERAKVYDGQAQPFVDWLKTRDDVEFCEVEW